MIKLQPPCGCKSVQPAHYRSPEQRSSVNFLGSLNKLISGARHVLSLNPVPERTPACLSFKVSPTQDNNDFQPLIVKSDLGLKKRHPRVQNQSDIHF